MTCSPWCPECRADTRALDPEGDRETSPRGVAFRPSGSDDGSMTTTQAAPTTTTDHYPLVGAVCTCGHKIAGSSIGARRAAFRRHVAAVSK